MSRTTCRRCCASEAGYQLTSAPLGFTCRRQLAQPRLRSGELNQRLGLGRDRAIALAQREQFLERFAGAAQIAVAVQQVAGGDIHRPHHRRRPLPRTCKRQQRSVSPRLRQSSTSSVRA